MLFSELYKITVNKVTFVGFRGGGDRRPGSAPGYSACTMPVSRSEESASLTTAGGSLTCRVTLTREPQFENKAKQDTEIAQ